MYLYVLFSWLNECNNCLSKRLEKFYTEYFRKKNKKNIITKFKQITLWSLFNEIYITDGLLLNVQIYKYTFTYTHRQTYTYINI